MNLFDYAIRMDEHGAQLFEQLVHDCATPEMKRIFGLLAAREWERVAALTSLKETISVEDARSSMVERAWRTERGYERLLTDRAIVGMLKTDRDGYVHILKAEEETIHMLEGMASAEPNSSASILLHRLAEDERMQLSEIENIYEFVEGPRTYLEWGEFSNLRPL